MLTIEAAWITSLQLGMPRLETVYPSHLEAQRMTTLIKFKGTREIQASEKKIKTALLKQKIDSTVIDTFIKNITKRKNHINDAFLKAVKEDPHLKVVEEKYGLISKQYETASLKTGNKVPIELIVSGGKPFLMVGKTLCVP